MQIQDLPAFGWNRYKLWLGELAFKIDRYAFVTCASVVNSMQFIQFMIVLMLLLVRIFPSTVTHTYGKNKKKKKGKKAE